MPNLRVATLALIGLGSGLVLAAGPSGCDKSSEPCGGFCGPGTVCEADRCIPAPPEEAVEPQPDEGKKGKKRRRRKGRKGGTDTEVEDASGAPPLVDDSKVPQFNAKATTDMGEGMGSERLTDTTVDREIKKLTPKFSKCVQDGALRVDDIGTGRLRMEFRVKPNGKVASVTVKGPSVMKEAGVIACVRKRVYDHRFPAWDGAAMNADASFDVD